MFHKFTILIRECYCYSNVPTYISFLLLLSQSQAAFAEYFNGIKGMYGVCMQIPNFRTVFYQNTIEKTTKYRHIRYTSYDQYFGSNFFRKIFGVNSKSRILFPKL